jgi:S1-C subfamily serine protease
MKKLVAVIVGVAVRPAFAPVAQAQGLDEVFRQVNPSVVVVRAKGRDVGAGGIIRFTETGSGVLISAGGRVMTAAHVINGMDEITVEGVAGEVVRAQIVSSVAAADVSLLQLERLPRASCPRWNMWARSRPWDPRRSSQNRRPPHPTCPVLHRAAGRELLLDTAPV